MSAILPTTEEVNAVLALSCLSGAEMTVLSEYLTQQPAEWQDELIREKGKWGLEVDENDARFDLARDGVDKECPVYYFLNRVKQVIQAHAFEVATEKGGES